MNPTSIWSVKVVGLDEKDRKVEGFLTGQGAGKYVGLNTGNGIVAAIKSSIFVKEIKEMPKKPHSLKRFMKLALEEVLPYVISEEDLIRLGKAKLKRSDSIYKNAVEMEFGVKVLYPIKMDSLRYRVFATKGVVCSRCGIQGKFFAVESYTHQEGNYHLNLYALREDGSEVLMTKDHIIPKSKGGKDTLKNLQPMCMPCNALKGSGEIP